MFVSVVQIGVYMGGAAYADSKALRHGAIKNYFRKNRYDVYSYRFS